MEKQIHYLISDAAKKVEVESHVLRYWEEELGIPIKRNELGHRYYTQEDVECFKEVKSLKEQGLQLKAIRMIVRNGKIERVKSEDETKKMGEEKQMIEIIASKDISEMDEGKEEKSIRLQMLLQHMITEAVKESNKEMCDDIKESVLKEMDYQFRLQEEREEIRTTERNKKEDEHYKRIDELLRSYSKKGKRKDGEKQSRFGIRKKPSIV